MNDIEFQEAAMQAAYSAAVKTVVIRLRMEGKQLLPPLRPFDEPTFIPCNSMMTEDIFQKGKALFSLQIELLRTMASNLEEFLAILNGFAPILSRDLYAYSKLRDYFCTELSWSLPHMEALSAIKNFVGDDRICEVAAGTALWSTLLQQMGVNIVASDIAIHPHSLIRVIQRSYQDVCNVDKPEAMLISWGRKEEIDLSLYQGKKLIIIGESNEGCTVNLPVYTLNKESRLIGEAFGFTLQSVTSIPNWNGVFDAVYCYIRN